MAGAAQRTSGRIIRREHVVDAVRTFRPESEGAPGADAGARDHAHASGGERRQACAGGASVTVFRVPDGAVDRLEILCRCGEQLTVYLDPEEGQG